VAPSDTDGSGLPLRRGEECRLASSEAADLDECARALRGKTHDPEALRNVLTGTLANPDRWLRSEVVRALVQMLMVEAAPVREILVEQLAQIEGKQAGAALARIAIYDLHPGVREEAIRSLRERAAEEYLSTLLQGFEHPWPPIANHAAEALVALRAMEAVPALVRVLEAPDPTATYQKADGKQTFFKEMVRIEHGRHCRLCHPPSFDSDDRPRALAPDGGISTGYYEKGSIFVRADITFLKQDFSVSLPVGGRGQPKTPVRFDFVVRERVAQNSDILAARFRQERGPCEQHGAAHFALQELTGRRLGPNAADWNALLRTESRREQPAPERQ
jgi:hypothetical protein